MVRYLKYIVIVFSLIGLLAGSFFFMQNRIDLMVAMDYSDRFEYYFQYENCKRERKDYLFPCFKTLFEEYLTHVSLTGTGIGMKMMFNLMDEDREKTSFFKDQADLQNFHFTINYLEVNNLALNNVYRRYHGFAPLYGGYIASLERYYDKGIIFSQNLINGFEGPDGISSVKDKAEFEKLNQRFNAAKGEFFRIKNEVKVFIDSEFKRLRALEDQL